MENEGRRQILDVLATGATAVVLLGMALWNFMAITMARGMREMLAELDTTELPLISKLVFLGAQGPWLQICSALLLLTGFGVLFATADRLRGVVYGVVVALLIAALTVIIISATTLPMVKVIQAVTA